MAHEGYDVIANDKPWQKAYDSVFNPVESQRQDTEFFMNMGRGLLEPYAEAAERGRFGEVVGRGAFDIGSLFIGAGEARGAAEVGQVTRVLEGAEAAAAAVRGMEGAEAARVAAQGADAVRVAEGIEGARGAASVGEGLANRSPVPPKTVPAPIDFGEAVTTTSPVPTGLFDANEVTEVIRRDAIDTLPNMPATEVPAPIEFPPHETPINQIPNSSLDEVTEVIRRDALDTMPDVPAKEIPAPIELPPHEATTSPVPAAGAFDADEVTEVLRRDAMDTLPDAPAKGVPAPVELPPAPTKSTSILDQALESFKKLIGGDTKIKDAPGEIKLPGEFNKGMQEAWDKSLPGGKAQEQGGILVQDNAGNFKWKESAPGTEGTIKLNREDVGPNEKLAGTGHTHPYTEGDVDVSFSKEDLSLMVHKEEPISVVQSGEGQFASAKSEEFNKRVQGLDKQGKAAMATEMESTWQNIFDNAKGTFQEKVQAAVKAVHDKFDLLYYEGKDGKLTRQ
jgi:hypothetical protein